MKTTINYLLTFILVSCTTFSTYAQPEKFQEKKEHIEALKVSYITQKLNLTKEEAQKFWPVYNEYQDTKDALHKEQREEFKSYKDRFDQLSEKELTEFVDK